MRPVVHFLRGTRPWGPSIMHIKCWGRGNDGRPHIICIICIWNCLSSLLRWSSRSCCSFRYWSSLSCCCCQCLSSISIKHSSSSILFFSIAYIMLSLLMKLHNFARNYINYFFHHQFFCWSLLLLIGSCLLVSTLFSLFCVVGFIIMLFLSGSIGNLFL